MNKTIYLDLDDVCVDMRTEIAKFLNVKHLPYKSWHVFKEFCPKTGHKLRREFFESYMTRERWAGMAPTEEFAALVRWAKIQGDVLFLTATPPWGVKAAASGKYDWVRKHAPDIQAIISCEKWIFSEENCLLIDDKVENCDRFNQGRGEALIWPQVYNTHLGRPNMFDKRILR